MGNTKTIDLVNFFKTMPTAKGMLCLRESCHSFGLTRLEYNQLVRLVLTQKAIANDAKFNAWLHCHKKGHKWEIYDKRGWEQGYDSPVRCAVCGEIEI